MPTDRDPAARTLRRLDLILRRTVAIGLVLVLCVPALRAGSAWFGAGALWLVAMPLASLWALHRFRLPARQRATTTARELPRRRRGAQARRWRVAPEPRLARAA